MDNFKERFRGRILSTEEGTVEIAREDGLRLEEQRLKEQLGHGQGLSKETKGRLEERLDQIARELNPPQEPSVKRKSIFKD